MVVNEDKLKEYLDKRQDIPRLRDWDIKIIRPSKDDINDVAEFIAEMNCIEENHIGYCGNQKDEIENELLENFDEMKFEDCFILAYDDEKLVGVMGFDADIEDGTAEIWGPFVKDYDWNHAASEMWIKLLEIMPIEIKSMSIFCNKENSRCIEFALNNNFYNKSRHVILEYKKKDFKYIENVDLKELTSCYYNDFKLLHDSIFPNTCYSGMEIINKLDEVNKVFIVEENNEIKGYIYVKSNPEFKEGSIEFLGVLNSQRGNGLGSKLLGAGLNWLFKNQEVEDMRLCANSKNINAISLYTKTGFKLIYDLFVMEFNI